MLLMLALACHPCDKQGPCETDSGRYFARAPASHDGALPVYVLIHGYQGSPDQYLDRQSLVDAIDAHEVLLVLPEGVDGSWSPPGSPGGEDRDELAFLDEVMADVPEHWSIDPDRIYASGFSLGASVVYSLACERAEIYAAAAPSSGGFWRPLPASCGGPGVSVRHVHGTEDGTWPIEGGREIGGAIEGGGAEQGSAEESLALVRDNAQCPDTAESVELDGLDCQTWTACADDARAELCTHGGGHQRPESWPRAELEWLLQFSR